MTLIGLQIDQVNMVSQEAGMSSGLDAVIGKPTAPAGARIDHDCVASLRVALQRYFELMHGRNRVILFPFEAVDARSSRDTAGSFGIWWRDSVSLFTLVRPSQPATSRVSQNDHPQ
jgi:hypothetical protein